MQHIKTKSVKITFAIMLLGIAIMAFVIPYYAFHWGLKPCQGLPTDANNCGDADIGGVVFIVVGFPIALLGLISTAAAVVGSYNAKFNDIKFLKIVYSLFFIVIAIITLILFF